jgi:hypothetical protein
MRFKAISTVMAAAAALLAPGLVHACSWGGNTYDRVHRTPLDAALRSAAFVERVRVEGGGASTCPRWPDYRADDEAWERYEASVPKGCVPDGDMPHADLRGVVLERFKGAGPDDIALQPVGRGFSDIARFAETDEQALVQGERSRADDGHASPWFWFQSDLGFAQDGSDSCGGLPVLVSKMDYLVFRNAEGRVVSAEPVSRPDDEFLAWIRRAATGDDAARSFMVQEAVVMTTSIGLVEITRCSGSRDGYPKVLARLDQGKAPTVFGQRDADGQPSPDTYYLGEWLAWRKEACRPMRLLVAETYAEKRLRGGDLDSQTRVWVPPMFAIIADDGLVAVADLFPGVRVTGPDRVRVEDIFSWRDEGVEN